MNITFIFSAWNYLQIEMKTEAYNTVFIELHPFEPG